MPASLGKKHFIMNVNLSQIYYLKSSIEIPL